MTGMLMALFLFILLKALTGSREQSFGCYGCHDLVRFNRSLGHFVHVSTGAMEAISQPEDTIDPLDPTSPLAVHLATPVDFHP